MLTFKSLPGPGEKEEGISRCLRLKDDFTVIRRVVHSDHQGAFKGRLWEADRTKLQISIPMLVISRFKKKISFVKIPVNSSRHFPLL